MAKKDLLLIVGNQDDQDKKNGQSSEAQKAVSDANAQYAKKYPSQRTDPAAVAQTNNIFRQLYSGKNKLPPAQPAQQKPTPATTDLQKTLALGAPWTNKNIDGSQKSYAMRPDYAALPMPQKSFGLPFTPAESTAAQEQQIIQSMTMEDADKALEQARQNWQAAKSESGKAKSSGFWASVGALLLGPAIKGGKPDEQFGAYQKQEAEQKKKAAEDAETAAQQAEQAYQSAWALWWAVKERTVQQAPDFEEKSKYKSSKNGSKKYAPAIDPVTGNSMGVSVTSTGYQDALYDAINGDEKAKGVVAEQNILNNMHAGRYGSFYDLPEDLKGTYNYICATEGYDAGRDYLEALGRREFDKDGNPVYGLKYSPLESLTWGFANGIGATALMQAGAALGDGSGANPGRVSASDWLMTQNAGAYKESPLLFTAGNVAGAYVTTIPMMEGISKGINAIKGFSGLPGIAKSIISGAATMGGSSAVKSLPDLLAGNISMEDYLIQTGASTFGGAVGGAASYGLSRATYSFLEKNRLVNNNFARTIASGLNGAAFTGAKGLASDVVMMMGYGKDYQPSPERIVKDIVIAFAFAAVQSYSDIGAEVEEKSKRPESEYFKGCDNEEELKTAYKNLAKQHHPDLFAGADAETQAAQAEIMKQVNAEYDAMLRWFMYYHQDVAVNAYKQAAKSSAEGDRAATNDAMTVYNKEIAALSSFADDGIIAGESAAEALEVLSSVDAQSMMDDAAPSSDGEGLQLPSIPETPTAEQTTTPYIATAAAQEPVQQSIMPAEQQGQEAPGQWITAPAAQTPQTPAVRRAGQNASAVQTAQTETPTQWITAPAAQALQNAPSTQQSAAPEGLSLPSVGTQQSAAPATRTPLTAQEQAVENRLSEPAKLAVAAVRGGTSVSQALTGYSETEITKTYVELNKAARSGGHTDLRETAMEVLQTLQDRVNGVSPAQTQTASMPAPIDNAAASVYDGIGNTAEAEQMTLPGTAAQNGGISNVEGKEPALRALGEATESAALLRDTRRQRGRDLGIARAAGEASVREDARQTGRSEGHRAAVSARQQACADVEPVSASVVTADGSEEPKLRVQPEDTWDGEQIAVQELAEKNGCKVRFVTGGTIDIVNGAGDIVMQADAMIERGTMTIRADSPTKSVSESAEHEIAHKRLNGLRGSSREATVRRFIDAVKSSFKEVAWKQIEEAYLRKYEGINEDLAGDRAKMELAVWEEILCSAYAGINEYGVRASVYQAQAVDALDGAVTQQTDGLKLPEAEKTEKHAAARKQSAADTEGLSLPKIEQKNKSTDTIVSIDKGPSAAQRSDNSAAKVLAEHIPEIKDMKPVAHLDGKGMRAVGVKASEVIAKFFESFGNAVTRKGFGKVWFNDYGVGGLINHKPFNRAKMVTLEAAPSVVMHGKQIFEDDNWKDRGYPTKMFAAPVVVADKTIYVAAVVDINPDNKFYLNECVDSEGNYIRINETPAGSAKNGVTVQDGVTIGPAEASDNIISTPSEKSKPVKKNYSAADTEGEYLALAEKYRDGTATEEETKLLRQAVEAAAKKAGYDTPMLYHGTGSFGFTEFDLSKMDDKSSVFATSSADVARTYSGATGSRAITDQSPDVSKMSDADVVEALNDYVKRYGDGLESVYSFVEPESAKNIARDAEKATADLAALVSKKVSEYADKLAKDFNDKNYTDHRHLVDFQEVLYLGDRNKVLSNLYMLINHTKVFSGTNADDLLRALTIDREVQKAQKHGLDISKGFYLRDELGGYILSPLRSEEARAMLDKYNRLGNYALVGKTGKSLTVEAKGGRWNNISNSWTKAITDEVTPESTFVDEENGYYYLLDKATNEPLASVEKNEAIDEMTEKSRQTFLINKAASLIHVETENMRRTREIAAYAKGKGFDSVIFRDLIDNGGKSVGIDDAEATSDIYVVFDPAQYKSADLVTYDGNGEIIPLSKRFNSKNTDIRYSAADTEAEKKAAKRYIAVNSTERNRQEADLRHLMNEREAAAQQREQTDLQKKGENEPAGLSLPDVPWYTPPAKQQETAPKTTKKAAETFDYNPLGVGKPPKKGIVKEIRQRHPKVKKLGLPKGYTDMAEYLATVQARAEETERNLLIETPREEFEGTPALQRMGIRIDHSVGVYDNIEGRMANYQAALDVQKAAHAAEKRLHATLAEMDFAEGVALGMYQEADIPESLDKAVVMELADYYYAEKAVKSDTLTGIKRQIRDALDKQASELFRDADAFKTPPSILMNEMTPERMFRKIFGDKVGEIVNRWLVYPSQRNEAEKIRWINRVKKSVSKFTDSKGKKSAPTKDEWAACQIIIEGRAASEIAAGMEMSKNIMDAADNIANGMDPEDAAKEMGLSSELEKQYAVLIGRQRQVEQALADGQIDEVKVKEMTDKVSSMFNDLYEVANDVLFAHGMPTIRYKAGYAPHMQSEATQNSLKKALQFLGVGDSVSALPTDIAGLTGGYKPGKRWNPYFLERMTDKTNFDLGAAIDSYVEYMGDIVYHMDDIARFRAASRYFRKTYSSTEISERISWAENLKFLTTQEQIGALKKAGYLGRNDTVGAESARSMIEELIDNEYSNIEKLRKFGDLVTWLDNQGNIFAGKQSIADRSSEYNLSRKVLNLGRQITSAFGKANVAGNLSSMLNQSAQLPFIIAEVGDKYVISAFWDIVNGELRKNEWYLQSDFLTHKHGLEYIVTTGWDKVITGMFKPAELMDSLMSTLAVRGAYLKNIAAGMEEADAIRAADRFGVEVMGSRAKGSRPQAYEAKNPISSMIHIFQVEAVNTWEHAGKDLPRYYREMAETEGKEKAGRHIAGVIVKMLLLAFALNRVSEELYGGTPVPFDVLGLTANFFASGEKMTTNEWLVNLLDNGLEKIFGKRLLGTEGMDSAEKFDFWTAAEDLVYNVSNDIPLLRNISGVLGLGDNTLPLPDVPGTVEDVIDAAKKDGVFSVAMLKALGNGLLEWMPGGKQISKTIGGATVLFNGGEYSGDKLKYPVANDVWTAIKLLAFGKYSTKESDRYFSSGEKMLDEEQTAVYQSIEQKVGREEAYQFVLDVRELGKDVKPTSYEYECRLHELIDGLNLNDEEKVALWSGFNTDESGNKWREKFENWLDEKCSWDDCMDVYEAAKLDGNTSRTVRDVIDSLHLSDEQKLMIYASVNSTATTRIEKFENMIDAGMTFHDCMNVYNHYSDIDDTEGWTSQQKQVEFEYWIDKSYNAQDAVVINDNFKYYINMPVSAKKYENLIAAGMSPETAAKLATGLNSLDDPSDIEIWRYIIDNTSTADCMKALKGVMDESAYAKIEIARSYDVSPDKYVSVKELMPSYDADGNGSYRNAEIQEAIDAYYDMLGTPMLTLGGGSNYTTEKAALWQLLTGSTSAKNNPYSRQIGQEVLDKKNAAKETQEITPEETTPTSGNGFPWISLPNP